MGYARALRLISGITIGGRSDSSGVFMVVMGVAPGGTGLALLRLGKLPEAANKL